MCLLSQQLEKADQERFELQKQLRALESGSALAAQKVCFAFFLLYEFNMFVSQKVPTKCVPSLVSVKITL